MLPPLKATNVFSGGNNDQAEQEKTYYKDVRVDKRARPVEGDFIEGKHPSKKIKGSSSQILQKTTERKEIAMAEPLPVERSEKRKLAKAAQSRCLRAKGAAVKAELMCQEPDVQGEPGSDSGSDS